MIISAYCPKERGSGKMREVLIHRAKYKKIYTTELRKYG